MCIRDRITHNNNSALYSREDKHRLYVFLKQIKTLVSQVDVYKRQVKMEDERAMGQLVIVKTDTDSKAALEGVEDVYKRQVFRLLPIITWSPNHGLLRSR